MITLRFPFDLEHPEVKAGFAEGQDPIYQSTRPTTDAEFAQLVRDFLDDSRRMEYNIGFLFGLYAEKS